MILDVVRFLAILSMVILMGIILYSLYEIQVLKTKIEALFKQNDDLKVKLEEKKDPYEDYRNEKGLLSIKQVKERYYGKS